MMTVVLLLFLSSIICQELNKTFGPGINEMNTSDIGETGWKTPIAIGVSIFVGTFAIGLTAIYCYRCRRNRGYDSI